LRNIAASLEGRAAPVLAALKGHWARNIPAKGPGQMVPPNRAPKTPRSGQKMATLRKGNARELD
jgi:hypothetical protein